MNYTGSFIQNDSYRTTLKFGTLTRNILYIVYPQPINRRKNEFSKADTATINDVNKKCWCYQLNIMPLFIASHVMAFYIISSLSSLYFQDVLYRVFLYRPGSKQSLTEKQNYICCLWNVINAPSFFMLHCKTINIECQRTAVNLLYKAEDLLTGYAFFQHMERSAVINSLFFVQILFYSLKK